MGHWGGVCEVLLVDFSVIYQVFISFVRAVSSLDAIWKHLQAHIWEGFRVW